MTTRERNIIKEIYPLACAGGLHAMKVLHNLTTHRRKAPKCKRCNSPIIRKGGKAFYGKAKYCSRLCDQISRRTKKPLLATACIMFSTVLFGADMIVNWVNDSSNPAGTQTVVGRIVWIVYKQCACRFWNFNGHTDKPSVRQEDICGGACLRRNRLLDLLQ